MSVVKPKVVIPLSITQNTHNLVIQSELEANTCSWREARENMGEWVTIGFGFTSAVVKKVVRGFF